MHRPGAYIPLDTHRAMGSVGAPGGIQGTRSSRTPYAAQPLFGRGNGPRHGRLPGLRPAPHVPSARKKTLFGGPTRVIFRLEGQSVLPSSFDVEAQHIAGSPRWTDWRAATQNQMEWNANAPRSFPERHGGHSIDALFAFGRITGFFPCKAIFKIVGAGF